MKLLDTQGIADLLGVTREHVTDRLTKQPDFPAPVVNVTRKMRRWDEGAVRAWLARPQPRRAAMSSSVAR